MDRLKASEASILQETQSPPLISRPPTSPPLWHSSIVKDEHSNGQKKSYVISFKKGLEYTLSPLSCYILVTSSECIGKAFSIQSVNGRSLPRWVTGQRLVLQRAHRQSFLQRLNMQSCLQKVNRQLFLQRVSRNFKGSIDKAFFKGSLGKAFFNR